eukprot:jgi/Botrbrau1/15983/Bobra.0375s0007.1
MTAVSAAVGEGQAGHAVSNGLSKLGDRRIEVIMLDLDDTLYQVEAAPLMVRERIGSFMEHQMGIPVEDIPAMCNKMYTTFGTTMAGLVASGYDIDADEWHEAVHASLPYSELLQRDSQVRLLLESLPHRLWLFTNADEKHANTCLDLLGLNGIFEGIICFESIMAAAAARGMVHEGRPIVCKPNLMAFQLALQMAGADPHSTMFLDDSMRNIAAARKAGIYSVLVGRTDAHCGDLEIESVTDLPAMLPELWEQQRLVPPILSATSPASQAEGRRSSFVMMRNNVEPAAGLQDGQEGAKTDAAQTI